jgi:hypothetical protein
MEKVTHQLGDERNGLPARSELWETVDILQHVSSSDTGQVTLIKTHKYSKVARFSTTRKGLQDSVESVERKEYYIRERRVQKGRAG